MRKGFTLVELSIVLVIIGLLIGGILVGQSLIESAQITKFIGQTRELEILMRLYKDKFKYLPGDDPNAKAKFGTVCIDDGGRNSCQGNGNGIIKDDEGSPSSFETVKLWEHMYLAGILHSQTPIHHTPSNNVYTNSNNAPKINLGSINIYPRVVDDTSTTWPTLSENGNHLYIAGSGWTNGIISPIKAKSIDAKLDDGFANTGKVIAGDSGNGVPSEQNCWILSYSPASGYDLSYTADLHGCRMTIKLDLL